MDNNQCRAYAYINQDKYLDISSSGGAFLGIVDAFFSLSGEGNCSVYGACFDKELNVKHERAVSFAETKKFCGSKYVHSDCVEAYKNVIQDLNAGYSVLFTGTPCQIFGLINILNKERIDTKKLVTVDIVCHGAPKAEIWKEYREYLEKKEESKLLSFSFRYKPGGWKGYPTYAAFENGKKYINTYNISQYITLFRKDLLMPRGCFNCKFPGNNCSDITIADFWGVEFCIPEIDDKKGVSLILFHNNSHELIEQGLAKHAKTMIEVKDEQYKKYNYNLVYKTKMPDQYDIFWSEYKKYGFDYIIQKYANISLKRKIKFYIVKILRKTGLVYQIKKMMHKP